MKRRKRVTSPIPLPSARIGSEFGGLRSHGVNASSLLTELADQYGKNNDLGVIRSWLRRNRHEANEKHLEALLSRVNHLRAHAQSLSDFKAELATQADRFELEVTRILEASEIELDRQSEEHHTFLVQQDTEREQAQVELSRLKLENDRIKLEHEKLKAETRLIILRGNLIEKITKELDLKNISPPQAFVLIKALNQDNTESDIFMAEEQLEQMKAEAELKKAEARQAGYDADYAQYKMKESMKE